MKSKKTAKLIQRTHLFRRDEFECSACGFRADKRFLSCPRCGAAIKGSKYDASWVDEMAEFDLMFEE